MDVIKKFYNVKSKSKIPLAPKLNIKQIELKSFSKMHVNLACQLLSNSVALGIETLIIVNLLDNTSYIQDIFVNFLITYLIFLIAAQIINLMYIKIL